MRIIAGRLKGHVFKSPQGHRTHPMSDKVRGALFNTLGDLNGLSVLDAFAGSGALSLEAISRGAARAVAIDADRHAQQAIKQNITDLGLKKQVQLIAASAGAWLSTTDDVLDIVLLDPPYGDTQQSLLQHLAKRAVSRGLVVCSLPPDADFALRGFTLIRHKDYGDAQLYFYRRD